jgi:serine/threonine protein kinase
MAVRDAATSSTVERGFFRYLAPEYHMGEGTASTSKDVYAFGCTMYEVKVLSILLEIALICLGCTDLYRTRTIRKSEPK